MPEYNDKPASLHERWRIQNDFFVGTHEEVEAHMAEQRKKYFDLLSEEQRKYIYEEEGKYKLRDGAPEMVAYCFRSHFEN